MNNPSSLQQAGDSGLSSFTDWRERFLKGILLVSCLIGAVAIFAYVFFTDAAGGVKLLAVLTYGILILVTVLASLPYIARAGVFLLLLYFSGFTAIFDYSIGIPSILFLGFIAMTALLFSPQIGRYAMGIVLLTVLIFGWARTPSPETGIAIGILALVSWIMMDALSRSQTEFTKTQATAHEMLDALQIEHSTLEQRVEERTAGLNRKTEQLRATSYIARKTAEVQDLASLLEMVAKLVTDQFGFYHTGIFLINETGDQAVLQAASSEGGRRMVARGHTLSVGTQGIVGYVAAQKKPRIAVDVGTDAVFFNNPDLPMTHSELALPLLVRNKVLGVLDIQSDIPQAFNADDVDVLQTLSDQIAIAIENARLLDETQAAIVQLEALTSTRTREAWNQKLGERKRVFTYTPLGLRAEKPAREDDNALSASIVLRGQKIGSISIARKSDAGWTKLDKDLIEEVANQVGLAIDNIRLLEEATQRAKQEQTIGRFAARFSQSLDLDTLLQAAARELGQLPDVSEISVFVGHEPEQGSASKQRPKRNVS